MDKEFLSDPVVVAGLLLGLAGLILLLGLALQAWANRRLGWRRPVSQAPAGTDRSDRGNARVTTAEGPITNDQLSGDQRLLETLQTRIDDVEQELEARIEDVEDALDAGIDEVEAKIATLDRPEDRHWMREFEARIEKVEAAIVDVEAKATTAVKPVTKDDEPQKVPSWIEEFDTRVKALQARIATTAEPVTNDRLRSGRRWMEETAGANGSDGGAPPIETRQGPGRAEETVARVARELERSSVQKTGPEPPGTSGPAD